MSHTASSASSPAATTTTTSSPVPASRLAGVGNPRMAAGLSSVALVPKHENAVAMEAVAMEQVLKIQELISGLLLEVYQDPSVPAPTPVSVLGPGAVHEGNTEEEERSLAKQLLGELRKVQQPSTSSTSTIISSSNKSFFDLARGIDNVTSSPASSSSSSSSSSGGSSSSVTPTDRDIKLAAVRNHPNYSIIELFLKVAQAEWQRQRASAYGQVIRGIDFGDIKARQAIVGAFAVYNMALEDSIHRWESFPVSLKTNVFQGWGTFLMGIFESDNFPRVDGGKVVRLINESTKLEQEAKKNEPVSLPRHANVQHNNYGSTNSDETGDERTHLVSQRVVAEPPKPAPSTCLQTLVSAVTLPRLWMVLIVMNSILVRVAASAGEKAAYDLSLQDLINPNGSARIPQDVFCAPELRDCQFLADKLISLGMPSTTKPFDFLAQVPTYLQSCVTTCTLKLTSFVPELIDTIVTLRQDAFRAYACLPFSEGKVNGWPMANYVLTVLGDTTLLLAGAVSELRKGDKEGRNKCKSILLGLAKGGVPEVLTLLTHAAMLVSTLVSYRESGQITRSVLSTIINWVLDSQNPCAVSPSSEPAVGCGIETALQMKANGILGEYTGFIGTVGKYAPAALAAVCAIFAIEFGLYCYRRHLEKSGPNGSASRQIAQQMNGMEGGSSTAVVGERPFASPFNNTNTRQNNAQSVRGDGAGTVASALSGGSAHATTTPAATLAGRFSSSSSTSSPSPSLSGALGANRFAPPTRQAPPSPILASNTANSSLSNTATSSSSSTGSTSSQSPTTLRLERLKGIVGEVRAERGAAAASEGQHTVPTSTSSSSSSSSSSSTAAPASNVSVDSSVVKEAKANLTRAHNGFKDAIVAGDRAVANANTAAEKTAAALDRLSLGPTTREPAEGDDDESESQVEDTQSSALPPSSSAALSLSSGPNAPLAHSLVGSGSSALFGGSGSTAPAATTTTSTPAAASATSTATTTATTATTASSGSGASATVPLPPATTVLHASN